MGNKWPSGGYYKGIGLYSDESAKTFLLLVIKLELSFNYSRSFPNSLACRVRFKFVKPDLIFFLIVCPAT